MALGKGIIGTSKALELVDPSADACAERGLDGPKSSVYPVRRRTR